MKYTLLALAAAGLMVPFSALALCNGVGNSCTDTYSQAASQYRSYSQYIPGQYQQYMPSQAANGGYNPYGSGYGQPTYSYSGYPQYGYGSSYGGYSGYGNGYNSYAQPIYFPTNTYFPNLVPGGSIYPSYGGQSYYPYGSYGYPSSYGSYGGSGCYYQACY